MELWTEVELAPLEVSLRAPRSRLFVLQTGIVRPTNGAGIRRRAPWRPRDPVEVERVERGDWIARFLFYFFVLRIQSRV